MTPQHFHIAVSVLLGMSATVLGFEGMYFPACFVGVGAMVALIYWKAAKTGITD